MSEDSKKDNNNNNNISVVPSKYSIMTIFISKEINSILHL